MKLSIAIADTNALPSAFVVFRGFQKSIPKAAKLGFDGVELALRRVSEINMSELDRLLVDNNIEVSCISTGQVFADGGLVFTHAQESKRCEAKSVFKEFIDMAKDYGKLVNIGRIRGTVGDRDRKYVEELFVDEVSELCEYARARGVTLLLEPVNRYECDFINTVEEGGKFLKRIAAANLGIMPDVFHMNIEERNIGEALTRNIEYIKYVHFADSNRLAPGEGHLDFGKILETLRKVGYDEFISIEILPKPSPDIAAQQAINFLRPLMQHFEVERSNGVGVRERRK
jgi:sugar phosphate isomerase/epimerase